MAAKIDTAQGRKICQQQFAVTEPVFANIRVDEPRDGWTPKRKIVVTFQWSLYCMNYNIEKIMKTQENGIIEK